MDHAKRQNRRFARTDEQTESIVDTVLIRHHIDRYGDTEQLTLSELRREKLRFEIAPCVKIRRRLTLDETSEITL